MLTNGILRPGSATGDLFARCYQASINQKVRRFDAAIAAIYTI